MDWLKHFQKYQTVYMLAAFGLFFFFNALTLASSRIMEEMARGSETLPFLVWEPFVWEFSSAVMILALVPLVNGLLQSKWLSWQAPFLSILAFLIGSVAFSVLHVSGMVAIRELCYALMGGDYRFGQIGFGFLYEYRKDLLTFCLLAIAIKGYRTASSQLSGEANLVHQNEEQNAISDRLLVRKLGKEFIVKIDSIDWFESSGNYVNLHVGDSVFPLRSTMADLVSTLSEHGFCRIHRSYAISLDRVASIDVLESGGADVLLSTGKILSMSRSYREQFKDRLNDSI